MQLRDIPRPLLIILGLELLMCVVMFLPHAWYDSMTDVPEWTPSWVVSTLLTMVCVVPLVLGLSSLYEEAKHSHVAAHLFYTVIGVLCLGNGMSALFWYFEWHLMLLLQDIMNTGLLVFLALRCMQNDFRYAGAMVAVLAFMNLIEVYWSFSWWRLVPGAEDAMTEAGLVLAHTLTM